MASRSARAVGRVIEHANKTANGANVALAVATQIGVEWRIFCGLTFVGRLWFVLTGRIERRLSRFKPTEHEAQETAADVTEGAA